MDSGDCETEEDSAPEQCVSPEGTSSMPSNSREMRNKAEKMRRDKLNSYIGQLATMVPMVAQSAKRMDKTSILRLTATHLRLHQTLLNGKNRPHMDLPKHVDQFILEQLVCEQLGGFLLILTPNGKIVFISHTVEHLLGHLQIDLMGQSIFNITSPEDHELLKMYISSDSVLDNEWKKSFNLRLKRAGPRTESAVYEPVRLMGVHRPFGNNPSMSPSPCPSSASTDSKSSTSSRDVSTTSAATSGSSAVNNDVLVFFVRVFRPEPLSERLLEATKEEYVTRHLIDGRIITCDQRISLIAGYLSEEVSGLSAFKFMHRDDVRWVMIALRQMYDRGESKGSSCYRLLSRNGQFIYLKTCGFLEIDDQGTVESFICVNTLVCEKEGLQLIDDMKKRFSALINSQTSPIISCNTNDPSSQSVEDPQQVDAAIVHLITNLPSPNSSTDSLHYSHHNIRQHHRIYTPMCDQIKTTTSTCTYYNSTKTKQLITTTATTTTTTTISTKEKQDCKRKTNAVTGATAASVAAVAASTTLTSIVTCSVVPPTSPRQHAAHAKSPYMAKMKTATLKRTASNVPLNATEHYHNGKRAKTDVDLRSTTLLSASSTKHNVASATVAAASSTAYQTRPQMKDVTTTAASTQPNEQPLYQTDQLIRHNV